MGAARAALKEEGGCRKSSRAASGAVIVGWKAVAVAVLTNSKRLQGDVGQLEAVGGALLPRCARDVRTVHVLGILGGSPGDKCSHQEAFRKEQKLPRSLCIGKAGLVLATKLF